MPRFIGPACGCRVAKEPLRVRGRPSPVASVNGSTSARIDLHRDRLSGDIQRTGVDESSGEEILDGVLMFPAAVRGSYELEIEFMPIPRRAKSP